MLIAVEDRLTYLPRRGYFGSTCTDEHEVPGDILEFGVALGAPVSCSPHRKSRRFLGFDVSHELPNVDKDDQIKKRYETINRVSNGLEEISITDTDDLFTEVKASFSPRRSGRQERIVLPRAFSRLLACSVLDSIPCHIDATGMTGRLCCTRAR